MSFLARRHSLRNDRAAWQLDPWLTLLAFALPLFSSWPLLGDDLLAGPHAGFILGVKTLGILPPPGYPLYLLSAHLLSALVPFGSLIWRINFISLLLASVATALFYRLGRQVHFPLAVSLAASLAFFGTACWWPKALVAGPQSLHMLLVVACLSQTVGLLQTETLKPSWWQIGAWAATCGLVLGQAPGLLFWILPILVIGCAWALPQQRAGARHFFFAATAFGCGLVLPYLYLPVRVLSPRAYINADFVPQLAELLQSRTLGTILSWSWWYLSPGGPAAWAGPQRFHPSLLFLFSSFTLLTLTVAGVGCFLTLRNFLFRRPGAHQADKSMQRRLVISGLPLVAAPATLLFLHPDRAGVEITLALTCACWSLPGLQYCYFRLGHSDEAVGKSKNNYLTWFGLLVIILTPLLAGWQAYPALRWSFRRAASSESNLSRAGQMVRQLPPSSLLFFPRQEWGYVLNYLQLEGAWRPDVQVTSLGQAWPGTYFGGQASLEFLGRTTAERRLRRENYLRYWMEGLQATLQRRPAFLFTPAAPPDPAITNLLCQVELAPESWQWSEACENGRRRTLGVYRLFSPAAPAAWPRKNFSFLPIAEYASRLRLLSAVLPRPLVHRSSGLPLSFQFVWQFRQASVGRPLSLVMDVEPAVFAPADGWDRPECQVTCPLLRSRPAAPLAAAVAYQETYQLLLPAVVVPGHYVLWLGVKDETTGRFWPLTRPERPRGLNYFIRVLDFRVAAASAPAAAAAP